MTLCRFLLLLVLLIPSSGSASLIASDFAVPGDGLLTYDDTTGFEWLDLTVTYQSSYADVQSQLGSGGAYAGFSIAAASEVVALFASGGWTGSTAVPSPSFSYGDPGHLAEVIAIVTLIGDTHPNPDRVASYGLVSDALASGNHHYSILFSEVSSTTSTSSHNNFSWDPNTPFNPGGVFLYRSAVPEPSTALLVGLGLLGMASRGRRGIDGARG